MCISMDDLCTTFSERDICLRYADKEAVSTAIPDDAEYLDLEYLIEKGNKDYTINLLNPGDLAIARQLDGVDDLSPFEICSTRCRDSRGKRTVTYTVIGAGEALRYLTVNVKKWSPVLPVMDQMPDGELMSVNTLRVYKIKRGYKLYNYMLAIGLGYMFEHIDGDSYCCLRARDIFRNLNKEISDALVVCGVYNTKNPDTYMISFELCDDLLFAQVVNQKHEENVARYMRSWLCDKDEKVIFEEYCQEHNVQNYYSELLRLASIFETYDFTKICEQLQEV